jgi:hypothetical protein
MAGDELLMGAVLIAGIVAFTVAHVFRRRLQMQRRVARDAMAARLAERFGDGDAFVAFARTPDGRALLENEYSPAAMAHRVLGLVQFGIIACAIGIAFLINGIAPPPGTDINFVREADEARWWGWLSIGLGIGLLVSAGVSAWLARRWQVLGE